MAHVKTWTEGFDELGLTEYIERFQEEGFDDWNTIADITENDFAALGVKLGHRRVLLRYIATIRGHPLNEPLEDVVTSEADAASTPGILREGSLQKRRPSADSTITNSTNSVQPKRRYKRHPRPDENAPQRPPSAYVMYANQVRENQREANLNFTQLARLVGDRWKVISPQEKESIEAEAAELKRQYTMAVELYKKSPEYKQYQSYLVEFKERALRDEKPEKLEPPRKSAAYDRIDYHNRYNYNHGQKPTYPQERSILPINSILGASPPMLRDHDRFQLGHGGAPGLAGYHLGMRSQPLDSYSRHLPFPIPTVLNSNNVMSPPGITQAQDALREHQTQRPASAPYCSPDAPTDNSPISPDRE